MPTLKSEVIQANLEGAQREADNFIGRLEKELEVAKGQRLTEQYQADLKTQIDQARAMYGSVLGRIESELAAAREQESKDLEKSKAAMEANAAHVKERMKAQLLTAWIKAGGDPDAFDEAWPGLYAAEMTKRALREVEQPNSRANTALLHKTF
jgi:hypothetical protein